MRGLYLASVTLHILAAMTWVGGMATFVLAVMPYIRRQDPAVRSAFISWFGHRFGQVSWTCFAVLAVTGAFNLWMRGVRVDDVLRPEWRATMFGRLLVAKLALVAVALAVCVAHTRVRSPAPAKWMGRSLLLLGITIVAVAVMLVRAL
jgi:putative copper export protein